MRKAERSEKREIIDLLTNSFIDNKSVKYIIKEDQNRNQRIAALMDYSFEQCNRFGEVFISDDNKGCALLLYPHKKKINIGSIWLDLKLIFRSIGIFRIGKAIERENRIKEKQPKIQMAYLWFIGVNPLYQHLGIGSNLLKEVIAHVDSKGLPIFLETSTVQNLTWYRRFGFEVYNKLTFTYTLHFLKRNMSK